MAYADGENGSLKTRLSEVSPQHPRLFVTEAEWPALKARVMSGPLLKQTYELLVAHADVMLNLEPIRREKIGKRLLHISRTCLQRVTYLAMAYRMTGDDRYLRRAEEEMLAASAFSDWNPSHFLDVAEMTAALAIGYDWLFDDMSEESRATIRAAIIDKGLKTSLDGGWWVSTENNWNQVCHAGLTLGALAVVEDEPELAETIVARAIDNLPRAMHEYEPDGVYPEGPSYWKYGTTFNVILIAALESVLGSDFGLMEVEGFRKTPHFYLHATGPTGLFFNFADCGTRGSASAAMHWFAGRLNDPALLWNERSALEAFVSKSVNKNASGSRTLAFLLLWGQTVASIDQPRQLFYQGDGRSPVVMARSGWDDSATYWGIKGGSPSTNHGHMDIGSFVLDMKGERWALDLGMQGYNSLESKGIDLWNRNQDSERWTVFRLNNFAHNTLVANGALQQVDGHAPVIASSTDSATPYAIVDMTPVYEGELAQAVRGVRSTNDGVLIQDDLRAGDQAARVRWGMVTRAKVTINEDGLASLEQNGKQVWLRVVAPSEVSLRIEDVEDPPRDYDAKNPNTRMILFDVEVPAFEDSRIAVQIGAARTVEATESLSALDTWKTALRR
jgi:hypothetical protein